MAAVPVTSRAHSTRSRNPMPAASANTERVISKAHPDPPRKVQSISGGCGHGSHSPTRCDKPICTVISPATPNATFRPANRNQNCCNLRILRPNWYKAAASLAPSRLAAFTGMAQRGQTASFVRTCPHPAQTIPSSLGGAACGGSWLWTATSASRLALRSTRGGAHSFPAFFVAIVVVQEGGHPPLLVVLHGQPGPDAP